MAYQILSFATSPFTQQRTYTILCDTSADLPATVDGYSVTQGFTAKIIEDGSTYIADSSGTWKKQPDGIQLDLTGYYTAAQTDSLLAAKQDSLTQTQLDAIDNAAAALPEIIDIGAKNKIDYTLQSLITWNSGGQWNGTWSGNVYTHNGINFTVNSDMTITANGTLSGVRALLRLFHNVPNAFGGMRLSGCPAGIDGSIRLEQTMSPYSTIAADTGSGASILPNTNSNIFGYITITDDVSNVTFKPMICTTTDWSISKEYVQYCPTLYELYQLVKSYHP